MFGIEKLRQISDQEFAALGMQQIAYIRAIKVNEEPAFAIHAADGTPVALLHDFEVAMATVRQHDMEPLTVH